MNISRKNLLNIAGALFLVATVVGLWFWQQEANYAADHPSSELAGVLQWVGIGIAALGAGSLVVVYALMKDRE